MCKQASACYIYQAMVQRALRERRSETLLLNNYSQSQKCNLTYSHFAFICKCQTDIFMVRFPVGKLVYYDAAFHDQQIGERLAGCGENTLTFF